MTSANTATAPKRRPLETVRAEDYIEYFLFPACANVHTPNDNSSHSTSTAGAVADVLEQTARQANAIAAQFGANYIWHKDGFRVAPRHGNASLLIDSDGADDGKSMRIRFEFADFTFRWFRTRIPMCSR